MLDRTSSSLIFTNDFPFRIKIMIANVFRTVETYTLIYLQSLVDSSRVESPGYNVN